LKHSLLLLSVLALGGCATNPGLDKRITCTLEGKAVYTVTYGPIALVDPVADADVICAKVQTSGTLVITPAPVGATK
jgi:outer membrane lipoprotein SlyB